MRKTKEIVIPGERSETQGERDNGKKYLLTEMSASKAEKWASRAFLALAKSGIDLPVGIERSGMAGIAQIAHLLGNVRFQDLEPLMDEIMACVQRVESSGFPRALVEDDIEEVATRQLLAEEVMGLHINFLLPATIFRLIAVGSNLRTIPDLPPIPTSRRRSASSSRRASQP